MIKRYDMVGEYDFVEIGEVEYGDYVLYADHAAFVQRVREALEVLEFDRTSGVNLYEAIHAIDGARFKLRAALLEVCNV